MLMGANLLVTNYVDPDGESEPKQIVCEMANLRVTIKENSVLVEALP
jgi:hypothetical protein